MQSRRKDYIICILFLTFLLSMEGLYLLQKPQTFSEKEKRNLAGTPELIKSTVLNGNFRQETEDWTADHMPGRSFFIGISAYADLLLNLQVTKEIYVGETGRLFECPVLYDTETIFRNMKVLNQFAERIGQKIDLMLIPSSGYLMADSIKGLKDPYQDKEIIETAYSAASDQIRPIDILSLFYNIKEIPKLYYKTDHHWTSFGAYNAYALYERTKGKPVPNQADYQIKTIKGFCGSTYSRACLWNTPPEELEYWEREGTFTVEFSEKEGTFNQLFFPDHLSESDKYQIWLDGNHPIVNIRNNSEDVEGKLLVIRDSFANCIGCFLADSYQEVTLVDLRYYKLPVSDLFYQNEYDDILVLYSIGNFMSDSNILWLQ